MLHNAHEEKHLLNHFLFLGSVYYNHFHFDYLSLSIQLPSAVNITTYLPLDPINQFSQREDQFLCEILIVESHALPNLLFY